MVMLHEACTLKDMVYARSYSTRHGIYSYSAGHASFARSIAFSWKGIAGISLYP